MNNIIIKKLIFFSSIISILNISGVIFACNDPIEVSSIIVHQDNSYQYHDKNNTLLDSINLQLSKNKKSLIVVNNSQELTSIEVQNMHNAIISTSPITDTTSKLDLQITDTFPSLSDLLQNNKKNSSKVEGTFNQIINIHEKEALLLNLLQNKESSPATLLIHTENNDLLVITINNNQGTNATRTAGLPYTDRGKKEPTDKKQNYGFYYTIGGSIVVFFLLAYYLIKIK